MTPYPTNHNPIHDGAVCVAIIAACAAFAGVLFIGAWVML